jgi:hypothetical protein
MELRSGEPLSLSKETDSQRRLYDLGIFARVNTAVQNPAGDEEQKNVLYDMDEARHYSLNVGVGAQLARIGGGVTSLDNPAGRASARAWAYRPRHPPSTSMRRSRISFRNLFPMKG